MSKTIIHIHINSLVDTLVINNTSKLDVDKIQKEINEALLKVLNNAVNDKERKAPTS